jgi:hypothetical protein
VGCWTSTRGERAAVLQRTAAGVQCAVLWQRYSQRYSHRVTSVAAGAHRALRALGELRALRTPRASLQRTASLTHTPTPASRPRCTRTVCALRRHLQQPGRQERVRNLPARRDVSAHGVKQTERSVSADRQCTAADGSPPHTRRGTGGLPGRRTGQAWFVLGCALAGEWC